MPVLVFLSGLLQQKMAGKLPMHFTYVYAGIAVSIVLAWAAHFLVEVPFLRKKL
jgi:peptidoglycan/LPS O-acetylase OafA/YrhL